MKNCTCLITWRRKGKQPSILNSNFSILHSQGGVSLLELIITLAILAILTAAALPLTANAVKGRREAELRYALREIRDAIDRYRRVERDQFADQRIPIENRTPSGYPKKLEILHEGFIQVGQVNGKKTYYLRRLPKDPMTGNTEWGLRSSTDEPDSSSTNGDDVYDVYTLSEGTGLNGTKYREW
ncbi:MAG: prepilin-type N-terminal cleavage/methylation domain-containing protein [Blastocatellia bacterium]|nr:prepilin-type N-terminal cleavage/methylation domain-containing protein [Blastocatellia bacterium]